MQVLNNLILYILQQKAYLLELFLTNDGRFVVPDKVLKGAHSLGNISLTLHSSVNKNLFIF